MSDFTTPQARSRRDSRLSLDQSESGGLAYGNTPASRRASVVSAIGSIQKFKESWMSVMFLKAGVGLGQVIVLIVLLVLATTMDSPLFPGTKQAEPTDACPKPVLLQSWMIVQIVRLSVCWSISCLVAVRRHRRETAVPRAQEEEIQIEAIAPSPSGSVPSLTHSPSSSSGHTIVALAEHAESSSASPERSYPSTMHSSSNSTASIDMLSMMTRTKHMSSTPNSPENFIRCSTPESRRNSTLDMARASRRHDVTSSQGERQGRRTSLADRLEKIAPSLTKLLGAFSFVFFILGNVLLFYPLPTKQQTCYHSSPMLWWGVMTVTGVGWFLFGQIIVVVLVIGVGGPAILTSLRRLPCFPAPVEPEPARAPQPDPLSASELGKLPVVCYIPHPDPHSSTEKLSTTEQQLAPPAQVWDTTRLPYPPHALPSHKAMCAICQENYTEPEQVRRVLYQADALRLLGCGHIYHVDCIDKWLTEKSSICPYCNRCARETSTEISEKKRVEGEEEASRWWRRAPPV